MLDHLRRTLAGLNECEFKVRVQLQQTVAAVFFLERGSQGCKMLVPLSYVSCELRCQTTSRPG
jgi:hypothetical protein